MSAPLCPSFAAVPGALLLGRLADDGTVGLLKTPLPVTQGFLDALHDQQTDADAAFRFAGPCNKGCSRWSHGECQVAKQAAELPVPRLAANELPDCGIRDACRWHAQEGPKACTACIFIARRQPAADLPGFRSE